MSAKPKNLIDAWGCADASPPELEAVLLKAFGGSTRPSPRVIDFGALMASWGARPSCGGECRNAADTLSRSSD